ncbi:LlaJI family restriction endonuclease [Clostridium perfringens]|nr:LlaJI family restriction endonuclease [Clostridium perfringens]
MNIISEYVREQKRYSKEELKKIFKLNNDEVKIFIQRLKLYGVLKVVNATKKEKDLNDLIDDELEVVDLEESVDGYYYIFKFVGVITVGKRIIKCFPKYLLNNNNPEKEMKQVLKVLKKYNSKEQIINSFNGYFEENRFNLLSIIIYILNDYYENGIYVNQHNIIESNGEGEILWDKTINETFAIVSNNIPFYIELQTLNMVDDDMNYFSRLHRFVITECSNKLREGNLLELFDMEEIILSDEELSDFGDVDYILYRINNELNNQFITRKQLLLKTLYTYISRRHSFLDDFGISIYGTSSFNLVWEKVCSDVFDNKLSKKLKDLKLPIKLQGKYEELKEKTLLEIIEKPKWTCFIDEKSYTKKAKDTLTPDFICIYENNGNKCFGIFDAKYYNIVLEKDKLSGYPGIGDVTKQYLYQLAYNDFIKNHRFNYVRNAFFMPTENDKPILNGEVEMGILKGLSEPSLTNILVVKLPTHKIYECYLQGKKIDINNEYSFL